uniref:RRM domain-containing protein n=1 Tax=Cyclophora tenuis TaxID=216820 RepID=A0A7S1GNM6_CYCTE
MIQVGLNLLPGNPITACRVSGKFAFIELRSPQEAANALNLNNIPFLGAHLRVGRPSKWSGPPTPHGNWEDILAKYMSGELKLPTQGGTQVPAPVTRTVGSVSKVVELRNMLTMDDLQDDTEYDEILEDTKEECGQFGILKSVVIPKANEPGATKVFLEYQSANHAASAIQALAGRTFDQRKVEASYFDETKFANRDFQ